MAENVDTPNNSVFDSNSIITWEDIKEGDSINHDGVTYEVAFKAIRTHSVGGTVIESDRILYLRPIGTGENVLGVIDDHDCLSLMLATFRKDMWTGREVPYTSSFHESWTEEYLASLRAEIKTKRETSRKRYNE